MARITTVIASLAGKHECAGISLLFAIGAFDKTAAAVQD
jgi:hypothetical protein